MRKVIFFFWMGLLAAASLNAQGSTSNLKVDKKIPVTGSERFDFVLTRSVLLGRVQGTPYETARSGAFSFGVGYGIPFGKSLELKFEPRVTWHKLYFEPTPGKWFPSADSSVSLIFEKQRVSYAELPVSFKFKLARNLVDRYKLLIEAGFVFGRRIGSVYKQRYSYPAVDSIGLPAQTVTVKTTRIPDLSLYRFGPFLRFGTNWLSVYGFYRMTEVFDTKETFLEPDGNTRAYPAFPKIEVGVTFAL